ncbi:MAG TPA: glycosyltransferase family 39 protein [Gemmatimonadota bacterium]|nr:glycosyltransferase family 39 protein [Gemmatimonadota bacterium]
MRRWRSSTTSGLASKSRTLFVLGALTLAGAALRVWLLAARPLMVDEGLTWETALRPSADFLLWSHDPDHPMLSFALVRLSLEIFGQSAWALRLPSFLAGVLCIPAAWFLGRRLDVRAGAGERRPLKAVPVAAALLAALIAFDPLLVVQSGLARMYSLLALLTLLTLERFGALIAADERRTGPWCLLGALLLAATWTHYLGYVLVAAVLMAAAWRAIRERESGSAWSRFRPALLAALVPIAGTLAPLMGAARHGPAVERPTALVGTMLDTEATTLRMAEMARLVIKRAVKLLPIGPLAPLLVLGGLGGLAVLARRSAALAFAVASMAAVTLTAVILGNGNRLYGVARYLLPWRLAIAIGLASLALLPGRLARAAATAIVALVCLAGAWVALPRVLPGLFAVGELTRSLAPGIDEDERVAFAPAYYEPLGLWYGLPVARQQDPFPRRPDGSLPTRVWIFANVSESRTEGVLWTGRLHELLGALEVAYRAPVDRQALEGALRAHGGAAIAFRVGSSSLHVPGESPVAPRVGR